jgi:hypothetical protein
MSPRKTSYILVLLACAAFATACERNDPTGPSEQPRPELSEHQGSDN